MKKLIKAISDVVAVLIVFAMVLVVFGGAIFLIDELCGGQETESVLQTVTDVVDLKLPGETEKMVVTVDQVETKIQEIGELACCDGQYTVTKGADFTRYLMNKIAIPGTTNHVELTCNGIVKAGYNLEEITVEVAEESKTIYVSLPKAEILSNQLLWDDSLICDEKNNILNPIDFEQYKTLLSEIQQEGLQQVKTDGLLDRVESNAQTLITNFLGCFVDYTVVYM